MKYEVKNQGGGKASMRIIGPIEWCKNSSSDFTRMVDDCLAAGCTELECYIVTPGGDMNHAFEICNQIKRFTGKKKCKLGAIVASSGTIIACAFDEVEASENTQYMVHNPAMGAEITSLQTIETVKNIYTNYRDTAIAGYVKKTGQKKETIAAWLDAETWMTATTAKDRKFVDCICQEPDTTPVPGLDDFLKAFKHAPTALYNLVKEAPDNSNYSNTNMKAIALALGLPENATEAEILAKLNEIKTINAAAEATRLASLVALGAKKGLGEDGVKAILTGNPTKAESIINDMKDLVSASSEEGADGKVVELPGARLANAITGAGGAGAQANLPKNWQEVTKLAPAAQKEFAVKNAKLYAQLWNAVEAHEHIQMTEQDVQESFS